FCLVIMNDNDRGLSGAVYEARTYGSVRAKKSGLIFPTFSYSIMKPNSDLRGYVFMLKTVKNKVLAVAVKAKNVLANPSGDQMTGWLIVVLIVVVVGAVFMTLYQGSITQIWNSIVSKITGLLS
ncbi:hypothetical protein L7E55_16355, partial [Pelotomaculum isophthalicicum JI]